MLEVLIVLAIAGIVLSVAVPQIASINAQRSVTNARDAFVFFGARARSAALEEGQPVCLELDTAERHAEIRIYSDDTLVERLDFAIDYGVQVATSTGDFTVCYSSTGLALQAYTDDTLLPSTITFTQGAASASALVQDLGQVKAS